MIEKEFKELLNNIEVTSTEKKEINSFISLVTGVIKDSKYVQILEVSEENKLNLTNFKTFNLYVCLSLKNKTLPYELIQNVAFNEVINLILVNIKNNIIYKDNLPLINKDYENNLLSFSFSDYKINFYFKYKKEVIIKNNIDNDNFYYEQYLTQKKFLSIVNKKYPRFNQTLLLVEYFINELNFNYDHLMYSIILEYGLNLYETDNSIIGYLKTFVFGLSDLIEEKTIIKNDDFYKELNVLGSLVSDGMYKVIDVSNKQKNLFNISIKKIKELKSLLLSKFPKEGKFVTLDCIPNYVVIDKSIEWCFKIVGTDITNCGGEYPKEEYLMCLYKGILKGLQFVVKNKLGNNIIILTDSLDHFPKKEDIGNLSYVNQSRYANLLAYIKDNDLGISYKIKE